VQQLFSLAAYDLMVQLFLQYFILPLVRSVAFDY